MWGSGSGVWGFGGLCVRVGGRWRRDAARKQLEEAWEAQHPTAVRNVTPTQTPRCCAPRHMCAHELLVQPTSRPACCGRPPFPRSQPQAGAVGLQVLGGVTATKGEILPPFFRSPPPTRTQRTVAGQGGVGAASFARHQAALAQPSSSLWQSAGEDDAHCGSWRVWKPRIPARLKMRRTGTD